jgi:hypothetical protein
VYTFFDGTEVVNQGKLKKLMGRVPEEIYFIKSKVHILERLFWQYC